MTVFQRAVNNQRGLPGYSVKSPRVLPVPVDSPGTGFSLYSRQSESILCVYGYPYGDSTFTRFQNKKKKIGPVSRPAK